MQNLEVPERGKRIIDSATWRTLRQSEAFWRLVTAKILKVEAMRDGRATLTGGAFVGRADIDDFRLDVVEKIPGALAALLTARTPRLRGVLAPSRAVSIAESVGVVAEAFLGELRNYIGEGRQWVYTTEKQVSSNASGRIRAVDTVRLRARGIRHVVAYDRTTSTRSTPLNVLLASALRELEFLGGVGLVSQKLVTSGRLAASSFADIRPIRPHLPSEGPVQQEVPERWQALADLARAVLLHLGPSLTSPSETLVPRSWFVNLELLFEEVVRRGLNEGSSFQVTKGGGPFIFDDSSLMQANPDLVVQRGHGVVGVGDVKYKDAWPVPSHHDVYQLLAHGSAFETRDLFLVYPGGRDDISVLGATVGGVTITAYMLDVANINSALLRLSGALEGLGARETGVVSPGPRWA